MPNAPSRKACVRRHHFEQLDNSLPTVSAHGFSPAPRRQRSTSSGRLKRAFVDCNPYKHNFPQGCSRDKAFRLPAHPSIDFGVAPDRAPPLTHPHCSDEEHCMNGIHVQAERDPFSLDLRIRGTLAASSLLGDPAGCRSANATVQCRPSVHIRKAADSEAPFLPLSGVTFNAMSA